MLEDKKFAVFGSGSDNSTPTLLFLPPCDEVVIGGAMLPSGPN